VAIRVGGVPAIGERLSDAFAPAKYVHMSDAEKLSAPSFQLMQSGVRVRLASAAVPAPAVAAGWTYDECVLTGQGLRAATPLSFVADGAAVTHALAVSAAADAPLRRTGLARYRVSTAGEGL